MFSKQTFNLYYNQYKVVKKIGYNTSYYNYNIFKNCTFSEYKAIFLSLLL